MEPREDGIYIKVWHHGRVVGGKASDEFGLRLVVELPTV